jgi:hypothetical protein
VELKVKIDAPLVEHIPFEERLSRVTNFEILGVHIVDYCFEPIFMLDNLPIEEKFRAK